MRFMLHTHSLSEATNDVERFMSIFPNPPTMFSISSCRKVYPDLNKNQQKGHFDCST